jgi:putative oxidoreductase
MSRFPIYTNVAWLLLRLGAGLMMMYAHGWGKLSKFGELMEVFPDPIGLGSTVSLALTVFAEFFCALAIALGFLTRLAAMPLVITMLVAVLVVHADDPFGKKELALLYLLPLLTLILTGAGRFSLDAFIAKKLWGKGQP